jgi:hypothetical protein
MIGRTISFIVSLGKSSGDESSDVSTSQHSRTPKRQPGHGCGPTFTEADEAEDDADIERQPWPPTNNQLF